MSQQPKAQEITSCEVCGHTVLEPVLNLGSHPLCDDLVPIGEDRICDEYPIDILYCPTCVTAHQHFQVPKRELFPPNYHYRSRFTADVLKGMSALVDASEQIYGSSLEGKKVFDCGCNDGSLLDFFQKKGAKTFGIEPTDAFSDGLGRGHDITNGFFSPETARQLYKKHGSPDIITFTNVFAHIENLRELIEALKLLMSPTTLLIIENHYLGSVLDRLQFDTFYHEHPRTYSLTSFIHIARSLGVNLSSVQFPSRYGGNIRVYLNAPAARTDLNGPSIEEVTAKETAFGDRLKKMQADISRWKEVMKPRIRDLVARYGPLSAKAFPGRAAILIKLLDLDCDSIKVIYEKPGSMKIGHYVPGTRIPIVSDDEFFALAEKPPVILNLAWHISNEIKSYLKSTGYEGRVIDIVDPNECGL